MDKEPYCMSHQIGEIRNYYGGLHVLATRDGKFWWSIENYDGHDWEEITPELFEALLKFNNTLKAAEPRTKGNGDA